MKNFQLFLHNKSCRSLLNRILLIFIHFRQFRITPDKMRYANSRGPGKYGNFSLNKTTNSVLGVFPLRIETNKTLTRPTLVSTYRRRKAGIGTFPDETLLDLAKWGGLFFIGSFPRVRMYWWDEVRFVVVSWEASWSNETDRFVMITSTNGRSKWSPCEVKPKVGFAPGNSLSSNKVPGRKPHCNLPPPPLGLFHQPIGM